ncbi:class I SAM-dependent DNA methyltransferase [Luteipulveratus flavus]|uniref:site-specific DNA-methyltransferase (adenine-specific) n=1 Tax=Luteipulveratus flavus TaxID=3031728 RepID=A0ABT6C4C8_9MICO|nr:class I SAM-dependent DNA methyltransferase [Luteipulveratus sp. YIM 133296]MDF8263737.1 class I SAM-dependent DNA methyltransferase [Luteipulveratus sp. YIM 133296]
MPPKKKVDATVPSTMKELKDTLWKAADKLRGSMDASQYKDVILGLVFLKYVSDAFEEARGQIRAELSADGWSEDQIASVIDDTDEYVGRGVFWVGTHARWTYLANHAKGLPATAGQPAKSVGDLIDDAMDLLMGSNPSLKGTLPRLYGRDNVDQRRLGELLDLFNSARFTGHGVSKARDLLGEVYEYFLEKFARAEGKRGGEFYTPAGVVRVLVEVLEPDHGRVYDPCCGSGGMFVQAEKFLEAHGKDGSDIAVYGQELNERTWRMAQMNLAIHGIDTQGLGSRWGDTFARDIHPDVKADFVMANPPFNIKDWTRNEEDARWAYGTPPRNNANYAWIQHILSKLTPTGTAGVVMANGSMSSNSGGEGDIRANLVEADLVSCMVALPTQLFRSTGIPVCLWFFAKDKSKGAGGLVDRSGQILFVDARELGHMVDRAERALSDDDIARIADTYHAWRGTNGRSSRAEALAEGRIETKDEEYADVPGFCRSVTLAEVKEAGYALTPGRFVGAAEAEDDGEPVEQKIERLTKDLLAAMDESARLDAAVRTQLGRL